MLRSINFLNCFFEKGDISMKFQKRGRLGTKLQMKCFRCRTECEPKNGDWHDGKEGQVFLCHNCGPSKTLVRPALKVSLLGSPLRA